MATTIITTMTPILIAILPKKAHHPEEALPTAVAPPTKNTTPIEAVEEWSQQTTPIILETGIERDRMEMYHLDIMIPLITSVENTEIPLLLAAHLLCQTPMEME